MLTASAETAAVVPSRKPPLTNPEKAFWKDAFLACAKSALLRDSDSSPEATADLCADFADAAMDAYRSRSITWRRP